MKAVMAIPETHLQLLVSVMPFSQVTYITRVTTCVFCLLVASADSTYQLETIHVYTHTHCNHFILPNYYPHVACTRDTVVVLLLS